MPLRTAAIPPPPPGPFDTVIVGAGHNGLVAACYLAAAGQRVLVLERNAAVGGATASQQVFPDFEARLSRYAYLVSLFPQKILADLQLDIQLRRRRTASYTPFEQQGKPAGLLLRNDDEAHNQHALAALHPQEYAGYQRLQAMHRVVADKIWDSFLEPLRSRTDWQRAFATADEQAAWRWLVERPVGEAIEAHLHHDVLRGAVLTDAKIGAFTHAHDPSLLQNRTYLYHVVGNRTGEWRVPVGGMGRVAEALLDRAAQLGVEVVLNAEAMHLHPGRPRHTLAYRHHGQVREVSAAHILVNAAPAVLAGLLGRPPAPAAEDEGSVFKINMLLKRLPRLRQPDVAPETAFAGTFHINQAYSQMARSYAEAAACRLPTVPPGEVYCHTLTDASILSPALAAQGYHTLTLFGLDMPCRLFASDNAAATAEATRRLVAGLDEYLAEPLEDCLATDRHGRPCLEAKSPVDLENELRLPQGNIFHNALSWFYAETPAETGAWGVETNIAGVLLCGSGARRGGAVSGIPGHNAAMKVLADRHETAG